MGRKFGFSFSAKRALGISSMKGKISRSIGIPLTRQGRQRKVGSSMGCCFVIVMFSLLASCFSFVSNSQARSGCCSHHGGVCGCGCCDGTSLSATCAPYYPSCGSSASAPTPTPQYIAPSAPKTVQTVPTSSTNEIVAEITKSKTDYFLNPDGFRETLINSLVGKFPNAIANTISSNVYKLLPDVVCNINKFNCPDFATHDEAQKVYEKCMQEVGNDIHRLDADSDGEACEANN